MFRQVLCVVFLLSVAEAAKILGIFMTPSISHQMVYQPIWKELSLRGHQVTIYTPNPINDPTLTNLTEVDLSFPSRTWKDIMKMSSFTKTKIEDTKRVLDGYLKVFEEQIVSPEMQSLIRNENNEEYDLFLVEYLYPGMFAFKDIFNCPMVGITSLPVTILGTEALGLLKHPVLNPDYMLMSVATDLSFIERVTSTLLYFSYKTKMRIAPLKAIDVVRKYMGNNIRDLSEITKDVSLVLGNYNPVVQNVKPTVPAFVGISGIHIQPEKPLPMDLKQVLDEAMEGVIYFSLGSNVQSSHFPEDKLHQILSAFAELPYKVLWKFEEDNLKNLSSNIVVKKWFPQQDVLRHRNIKLFITQGGLQSIDEALNSRVPLLFMPFYGDQHLNSDKMVKNGAGLSIDHFNLTKDELKEKITEIITNPVYKRTVTKLGAIAFDDIVPPLEKSIWWIEYVLRHNGASHLRYKSLDIPFYQYYLLDVFLFLAVVCYLSVHVILRLFKILALGYSVSRKTLESISTSHLRQKKSQ